MNTRYALHAVFGKPIIPVKDICEDYFNCKVKTANERIKALTFPIPAFRLTSTQSGEFYVSVDELADYIDKQSERAKAEWASVGAC